MIFFSVPITTRSMDYAPGLKKGTLWNSLQANSQTPCMYTLGSKTGSAIKSKAVISGSRNSH